MSKADHILRHAVGYFVQFKTGWPDLKEAIIATSQQTWQNIVRTET